MIRGSNTGDFDPGGHLQHGQPCSKNRTGHHQHIILITITNHHYRHHHDDKGGASTYLESAQQHLELREMKEELTTRLTLVIEQVSYYDHNNAITDGCVAPLTMLLTIVIMYHKILSF